MGGHRGSLSQLNVPEPPISPGVPVPECPEHSGSFPAPAAGSAAPALHSASAAGDVVGSAWGVPTPASGRQRWHILPVLFPSVRVVHLLPAAPIEQGEFADLRALHAPAQAVLPLQYSQALVPLLAAVAVATPLQADEVEVGVPGAQGRQRAGGHWAAQDAGGGGGGRQVNVQAVVVLQVQGEGLSQGQVLQGAVNW